MKGAVVRVPAGAAVQLVRDEGGWSLSEVFALREQIWASRDLPPGTVVVEGGKEPAWLSRPAWAPGWHVDVDGRTVLFASDAEIWPPPVLPRPSWRVRMSRRVRRGAVLRARALGDAVAHRFGYIHQDED